MNIYGKSVSSTAAALYNVLCSLARTSQRTGHIDGRGAYVYASRRQLGQWVERSERTAQRAIAELKAAGLIYVRRMGLHSNDRIYIADNGRSEPVKNGRSGITIKSNNILADISILQDKTQEKTTKMAAKAADDAKMAGDPERIQPAAAEKMNNSERENGKKGATPKKDKPKQKRLRITKAEKEAAKERYRSRLEKRLDMSSLYWGMPGFIDEGQRRQALIDLIAEAMSVPGRQIRVNGAGLTVEQYWQVVQNINTEAIEGLFDRLCAAEAIGGIANKRAYTLAAVYNAVQWHSLTNGASIPTGALYQHLA